MRLTPTAQQPHQEGPGTAVSDENASAAKNGAAPGNPAAADEAQQSAEDAATNSHPPAPTVWSNPRCSFVPPGEPAGGSGERLGLPSGRAPARAHGAGSRLGDILSIWSPPFKVEMDMGKLHLESLQVPHTKY